MSVFQPFAFQTGPSGVVPPAGFPYEADLFARYVFNGSTGTTVNDVSGNGVDLIANSTTILGNQTTGIFSGEYCGDFTGGNYVAYNTSSPFGCSVKPFTYSFWANQLTTPANMYLGRINRDSGCGTAYGQTAFIAGYAGNVLEIYDATDRFVIQNPFLLNQWQFITMTYAGTDTVGATRAYINGVFVATNAGLAGAPALAADVMIGAGIETGLGGMNGYVDQWSLHNFQMNDAQVLELYNWYTTNPNFIG